MKLTDHQIDGAIERLKKDLISMREAMMSEGSLPLPDEIQRWVAQLRLLCTLVTAASLSDERRTVLAGSLEQLADQIGTLDHMLKTIHETMHSDSTPARRSGSTVGHTSE